VPFKVTEAPIGDCEQLANNFRWTARTGLARIHTRRGKKTKMTNEVEQQETLAAADRNMAAFMEAEISRLKGRLEKTLARSHTSEHWEGMIEDCDIILSHLESRPPQDGPAKQLADR
jgi:hypothetical protein